MATSARSSLSGGSGPHSDHCWFHCVFRWRSQFYECCAFSPVVRSHVVWSHSWRFKKVYYLHLSHHVEDTDIDTILSEKMCMVVRWCFLVLAVIAFFIGARATYRVFDGANLVVATIVVLTYWETIRSTTVPSSH